MLEFFRLMRATGKIIAFLLSAVLFCNPLVTLAGSGSAGGSMFVEPSGASARSEKSFSALASKLNSLAQSLINAGASQDEVACFLMRVVFTCYAEDIGVIQKGAFQRILTANQTWPERCRPAITSLWQSMKGGGGGWLFDGPESLPLDQKQIALLLEVTEADWGTVNATIFGNILENALAPVERQQLGTHYTPASYVEKLVVPTIIDPLKKEWEEVDKKDGQAVREFHERLCKVVVLDPACGSGNFLAISFELLSAFDNEVVSALRNLGQPLPAETISIQQFRGVEIAPHAADVCELVLRVSWLKAYFQNHRGLPGAIDNKRVVECRDALLKDEAGNYGEADPWPQCDYIVGNPPFVGAYKMKKTLGDKYTEDLRKTYHISGKADLVMFWWKRAACLVRDGKVRQFGFIVTQGVRNKYNSAVVGEFLDGASPISIVYAIPDHPWLLTGAGVRIAMTVCARGDDIPGTLATVASESPTNDGYATTLKAEQGIITPMLTLGADLTKIKELRANEQICGRGVMLSGRGFVVTKEQAKHLGLGTVKGLEKHVFKLCNGKDLTGNSRDLMVLDMTGMSENEVKEQFPAAYQWLAEHIKPVREQNRNPDLRRDWWLFSSSKEDLRKMIGNLNRYIATSKTMQRRFFVFLGSDILPDDALTVVASDDAYHLGVLSSKVHCDWAAATGSRMVDVLRYDKTRCFDSFPFPDATNEQQARIRSLAEKLDAHRKTRQEQHPSLTLAEMYGVLEKIQKGERLTADENQISHLGDLPTLQKLHSDLDAAVLEAYGWPTDLKTSEIISRLFALNQDRAAEEGANKIRWLSLQAQIGSKR